MSTDWTPADSVAALLVGLSMVDGEVDAEEVRALVDVLSAVPGLKVANPAAAGQRAYKELWTVVEQDGDLVAALEFHGTRLAGALPKDTLEHVLERLEDMADADGEMHPLEIRLINAFRISWDIEQDGFTMS